MTPYGLMIGALGGGGLIMIGIKQMISFGALWLQKFLMSGKYLYAMLFIEFNRNVDFLLMFLTFIS